jgi:hypothetical protein
MEEFALEADRLGFIALRAMPVFEAAKASGTFGKIPLEELLKNADTRRAPGSGYSRGGMRFETDSYATEERGREEPVDRREATMYREYFDAELAAARRARDIVLRNQERRTAALLYNPTTFAAQLSTLTNEWDDHANATPIDDVNTIVETIWARSGLWANALLINRIQFRHLRRCDQIIDRIASSGAGAPTKARDITVEQIAQCLDLDRILVAGGAKNAANEGQAASVTSIWSNEYAMVARVMETSDIREPGLGRTIHWGEDGSEIGALIESYWEEQSRSDIVRARHDVQEKIFHVGCAQLIENVMT